MLLIQNGSIGAFGASFLEYLVVAAIMVAVAAAGAFIGKKLRDSKDAKRAAEAQKKED